jgi:hypothetical protein
MIMTHGGCVVELAYSELSKAQKAYLKDCNMHVIGLHGDLWEVTIKRGSRILMRDIFSGDMGQADQHGRMLAYKAALTYCSAPEEEEARCG